MMREDEDESSKETTAHAYVQSVLRGKKELGCRQLYTMTPLETAAHTNVDSV